MWGQGDTSFGGGGGGGAGGFLAGQNFESPSQGGDKQKARRSQNIIPVTVKQLLDCTEDAFKLEDFEANVVTIVGLVRAVETSTTKMSMYIEDQTGTIECVNYIGTDNDGGESSTVVLDEGSYGRVVGALRSMKNQKYVIIFKAAPITDMNELTCHILEVMQSAIKLKKLREGEAKKAQGVGASGMDNTFSNSMLKTGLGATGAPNGNGTTAAGIQGFTANQNLVHRIISSARDEAGMHKDQIISAVKNQMSLKDLDAVLEFLSNEGHVFSTVDDDHYRSTDAQYT